MTIGFLLLIAVILTVSIYILIVERPALKRAERAARKRARQEIKAELENEYKQLIDLYILTFILED